MCVCVCRGGGGVIKYLFTGGVGGGGGGGGGLVYLYHLFLDERLDVRCALQATTCDRPIHKELENLCGETDVTNAPIWNQCPAKTSSHSLLLHDRPVILLLEEATPLAWLSWDRSFPTVRPSAKV
jgi:hypothetical protein